MLQEAKSRLGIIGVGPGTAAALEQANPANTVVLQRDPRRGFPLRSTYTIVSGYENLFDTLVPDNMRRAMSSLRIVSDKGTDFTIPTSAPYYMIDFPAVMKMWHERAKKRFPNIQTLPPDISRRDIHVSEEDGVAKVNIQGTVFEFGSVVDGTGNPALIASQIEPARIDENPFVEYIYGGTFKGEIPQGQIILAMGPGGGGTSWVNESIYSTPGNPLVDACFSGWGYRSHFKRFKGEDGRNRLEHLRRFMNSVNGVHLEEHPVDVYTGMIRSERPSLPLSATVYAVGEAGGIAGPMTGESFNRSLRSGQVASDTIANGGTPADYHREFFGPYKKDGILYSAGLKRQDAQRNGEGMKIVELMGEWDAAGLMDDKMFAAIEKFMLGGQFSPLFLRRMLTSRQGRFTLFNTFKTAAATKTHRYDNTHHVANYPFAPVENLLG